MNQVLETLLNRKSVRAYEDKPIEPDIKAAILKATLRAPTAGNMMLYSIIDVTDQPLKDRLAITCDNQPFIARAPTARFQFSLISGPNGVVHVGWWVR